MGTPVTVPNITVIPAKAGTYRHRHPGEGRDPGPSPMGTPVTVPNITVIPAKAGTHFDFGF